MPIEFFFCLYPWLPDFALAPVSIRPSAGSVTVTGHYSYLGFLCRNPGPFFTEIEERLGKNDHPVDPN